MKAFDSFPHKADYAAHVERAARKGFLLETSVDEATNAAMLELVLSPEPPDGFYVEVGPGWAPYAIGTARQNICYLAIEGGESEYPPNRFSELHGWGEYHWIYADEVAGKAASLPEEADTRSAQFMWGDAQRLPFPDRDRPTLPEETRGRALPIRETFMRNVLLTPGVHPCSIEKIFREQARVLAEDGLLVIRETNFDLLANLELTGFRRRVVLFDTNPAFRELIKQYPGGDDNKVSHQGLLSHLSTG